MKRSTENVGILKTSVMLGRMAQELQEASEAYFIWMGLNDFASSARQACVLHKILKD
jgi:hypothetical protein